MLAAGPVLDWLTEAQRVIPPGDRKVLLSPPRLVARFARFAWARHGGHDRHAHADDIAAFDPALVALMMRGARLLARVFRLQVEGLEHVPRRGAALLVGNHNGGLVPMDGIFTALALFEHFAGERRMYSLAHDFLFDDPLLRRYAGALGLLRADGGSAAHAFAGGHLVLVYPGSDLETFRPFNQRRRIVLGGRKGFLRLALRQRVPIVPVVSSGTHEQFIVLSRGDRLAKLLHAHRWARTDVFPLVLSLPWGLTSGFVPYLPLPAQTSLAFAPPLVWPDLGPEAADDPVVLDRLYHQVEDTMQHTLDRLEHGRRVFFGRWGRPS